jgi:uncharacterized protein YycO
LESKHTETLDLSLEAGDLIFIRTAWYSTLFDLAGHHWTHVGMYVGDQLMVEAILTGNDRSGGRAGVVMTPLSGWSYPSETYATLVRVMTTDSIRQKAVTFVRSKLGQDYDLGSILANEKKAHQPNYYCSELIWAAYYDASKGDIDLGNTGKHKNPRVSPDDIAYDTEHVERRGYHYEHCP